MSFRTSGDIPAVLYLVPFAASGVYALVLWVQNGLSLTLPGAVYLTVTRDPYLFLIGLFAVLLGVVLDVRTAPGDQRWAKVLSLSNTVQSLAGASLVLVLLSALYANGFDPAGAATDFIVGRYGIVFPALLFMLSYLMRVQLQLGALRSTRALGLASMIMVPVTLLGIDKLRGTAVDVSGRLFFLPFIFLALGLFLLLWPGKKRSPKGA